MRPLSQGAPRGVDARAPGRANVDCRTRRGRAAAGTSRLIGAIVAGGASSRFGGEPKGLRAVGGARVIDRVLRALKEVTPDVILISNASGAGGWVSGVRAFADVRPERGSLVGVHTALVEARDSVLVVAWDMPFVTSELLRLVRDRSIAGSASPAAFATVPVGAKGPEPFCAVYTPPCIPFAEAALDAGDFRMSHFLRRLPRVELISAANVARAGDPRKLFFNVNDAADLAAAEAMLAGE